MRGFLKIVSLSVIFTILVTLLPDQLFIGKHLAKADSLLTREEVQKYKNRIDAGYYHSAYLNGDGEVLAVGENGWEQTNVSKWRNIIAISAGFSQTVGLKSDGTVDATGNNPVEESKVQNWSDIIQISAGEGTTVGLKSDRTVVAVGSNYCGQSNVEKWNDIVSISAGGCHTVGLKSDGTVVAVGDNNNGETNVSEWENIVEISAGYNQTIGLKADGTVIATGSNYYGETDINGWEDIIAISAGVFHTVGLKSNGTVVTTPGLFPGSFDVSEWNDIVAISTEGQIILGLKRDGSVVSTGKNSSGQGNLQSMEDLISVSTSSTHTLGLKADGSVIAIGNNNDNETALSEWKDINYITSWHGVSIGVKNDGKVVVAGDNFVGATKEKILNWENIQTVSMSTGGSHTVGLKKDGTVIGVGNTSSGQLNIGEWKNIKQVATGSNFTIGLKHDGTVIGTGDNHVGQINVSGWKDIVAISADQSNTVGLKSDGTVVATGWNYFGQNNVESWKDILAISTKDNHTVGLKKDGTVVATGDNRLGQNDLNEWKDIIAISTGTTSTIGLKADGSVVVAGANPNLTPVNFLKSVPVESFDVSKKVTKTGDVIKLRVNFTKAMETGINLKMRGVINNSSVTMEMVPDSNGKSFQYTFTVPSTNSGKVHFKLTNIKDQENISYNSFYVNNSLEVDNDSPTITGVSNQSLFINSSFNPMVGITATDHFIGDLTNAISITGTVNITKKGVYPLTYKVMDRAGNITTVSSNITIVDNIKPVISGATSKSIFMNTTFDPRAGVTATDNSDGNLTSMIKINGLVNSIAIGTYTLTYDVMDSSGNQTSVIRKITVMLGSPTSLKAVSNSYNSVKLSWTATSGASGYEIYRSTSSTGNYTKIATTSSNIYTNAGLNTGTTYYYKVRAYKTGTQTTYSNFSLVVSAKSIPATPISAKAASSSYNSIKTSWAAVSGASGYQVYRATTSTGTYSLVGTTTATSFNNVGLTTNKPYYYKIRAYRTVGSTKVYSNYSAMVTSKPIPSVPANFKASRYSSNSIKMTWSSVAGATGYQIYRSTSSSGTYSLLKSTTSLYYINSGLATGKTYYYKLRAYRTVGTTKVYSYWTTVISAKP